MRHVVKHVAPHAQASDLSRIRVGVWRVLSTLEQSGQVEAHRENAANGSYAEYSWKDKTITSSSLKPLQEPSQYVREIAP